MIIVIMGVIVVSLVIGIIVLVFASGDSNSEPGAPPYDADYYSKYEKSFLENVDKNNIANLIKQYSSITRIMLTNLYDHNM